MSEYDEHPAYSRGYEAFQEGEPRPAEPDPDRGQRDTVPAQLERQGWDDARDNAAEQAYHDMCTGEPPISAQERYEAAYRQKMELRR